MPDATGEAAVSGQAPRLIDGGWHLVREGEAIYDGKRWKIGDAEVPWAYNPDEHVIVALTDGKDLP